MNRSSIFLFTLAGLALTSLAVAQRAYAVQWTSPSQTHAAPSEASSIGSVKFAGPGTAYCFGVNCPCGNDNPTAGCMNSTGGGALFSGFGTSSVSAGDLGFDLTGLPPSVVTLVITSLQKNDLPFKDGRLCLGGTIWRLWKHFNAGQDGAIHIPGVANLFAIGQPFIQFAPGEAWNFQGWYRDPATNPLTCGKKANLTNGYEVVFQP